MSEKIKVSEWFDEWITEKGDYFTKKYLISLLSPCVFHDTYIEYRVNNHMFGEKQYQEIRDNFEDYVRAILDGNYEVEKEKTPIGWIPKVGEDYWYVGYSGKVYCETNATTDGDYEVFNHTKVFKTKEEAEFEAEKMKVTRELEKYACEYIKEKENYCLTAHYNNRELWTISIDFDIFQGYVFKRYGLYFESEERAQEAIKAVGEDRVLKYYFGVENE